MWLAAEEPALPERPGIGSQEGECPTALVLHISGRLFGRVNKVKLYISLCDGPFHAWLPAILLCHSLSWILPVRQLTGAITFCTAHGESLMQCKLLRITQSFAFGQALGLHSCSPKPIILSRFLLGLACLEQSRRSTP